LPKKIQSQNVTREKLQKNTFVQKGACKMLMKLTPAVNITNILLAAFTPIFFGNKIQAKL
jgi:hypothetical protein